MNQDDQNGTATMIGDMTIDMTTVATMTDAMIVAMTTGATMTTIIGMTTVAIVDMTIDTMRGTMTATVREITIAIDTSDPPMREDTTNNVPTTAVTTPTFLPSQSMTTERVRL